jgi:two-component system, LytTR family, response regulator
MISEALSDGNLLRSLVVESDTFFRNTLIDLLSSHPAIRVVKVCSTGLEAIASIRELKPDVLICEVEAAGVDGFAILETISLENRPATIFISNCDRFAARAFDVAAIDYLVRPIRQERLWKALERARSQVELMKIPDPLNTKGHRSNQLVIKSGRSMIFIKSDEVDWAEAEGKYVRLHMGKEFLVLKMSISSLEAQFDPDRFVRIHRSTLINVDRVRCVQPWNHRRTYQVTLQDGTQLVLSRKSKLLEISGKTISNLKEASESEPHSNDLSNIY